MYNEFKTEAAEVYKKEILYKILQFFEQTSLFWLQG
jgi:hypothetical protein